MLLVVLKAVAMSWLTVWRMMAVGGGYRSPEDAKRTPLNPEPRPGQLEPDERVERIRRIQLNDLENLPFFFMAGFLYVLSSPSAMLAHWLFYGGRTPGEQQLIATPRPAHAPDLYRVEPERHADGSGAHVQEAHRCQRPAISH